VGDDVLVVCVVAAAADGTGVSQAVVYDESAVGEVDIEHVVGAVGAAVEGKFVVAVAVAVAVRLVVSLHRRRISAL